MPTENRDPTETMIDQFVESSESQYVKEPSSSTTDDDTSGQADDGPAAQTTDTGADTDTANVDPQRDAANQQQRPASKTPAAKPDANAAQQRLNADKNGNLINAAGQIIAAAGAQRRHYEGVQRELSRANGELARMRGTVEAYERTHAVLRESGLSPGDLHTSARLLVDFRRDPAGTIRTLVTEARARGHNVDLDAPGMDAAAMRRMVDEATAPLRESAQARRREQEAMQRAEQEVTALYNEHPAARAQEQSLVALTNNPKFQGWTLREKYLYLQNIAQRHGLDTSRDIGTQIIERARAAQAAGQQPQNGADKRPANGALPTGNGNAATPSKRVNSRSSPAPAGTSVDDIVHAAFLENGISVVR